MDFQITQHPNGPGNVSVRIVIVYSTEEASALTELKAWDTPCTTSLSSATFRHFVDPGVMVPNCIPLYADHFQARFNNTIGWEIQTKLAPILDQFRRIVQSETEGQRDAYFTGRTSIPYTAPRLLPEKK